MNKQQYDNIVRFINTGKTPEEYDTTSKRRSFQNYCKPFQLEEDVLTKVTKWQQPVWVLKEGETEAILYLYHNDPISGHFGKNKVFDKMKRTYFWPGMYRDIEEYIATCHTCQMRGQQKKNNELSPIEPTGP